MVLRAESDAARAAVFCLSQIQQYNVQVSELEPHVLQDYVLRYTGKFSTAGIW